MSHLVQCKLLQDPQWLLFPTSKTNRQRRGRQGNRDRDLREIWKLLQYFSSASGFSFRNFIEKLNTVSTKHLVFFYQDSFLFYPSFLSVARSMWNCWDLCSQRAGHLWGVGAQITVTSRGFTFSQHHITAAWPGAEKSPPTVAVITLFAELMWYLWATRAPHLKNMNRNISIRIWTFDSGNPWAWLGH